MLALDKREKTRGQSAVAVFSLQFTILNIHTRRVFILFLQYSEKAPLRIFEALEKI